MMVIRTLGPELPEPARRIVSLVPSLTELLHHLGLEEETVGITKFCVHPEAWFRTKTRVGGTKNVDLEKVQSLQPDLIIASKEENVEEQVMALARRIPVLLTDIATCENALEAIAVIGSLCNRQRQAAALAGDIRAAFDSLLTATAERTYPRVAYCIWREPWMFAGGDTFISSMLQKAGFHNLLAAETRYPVVPLDKLASLAPDLVFLSSEPYPFGSKHVQEVQAACPGTRVMLVDGESFSWYGSRMLQAPAYFATLHQQWHS